MTRRIAIGVDQGSMTGVAGYGSDGFEFSFQDEERPALLYLLKTIHTLRNAPDVQIIGTAVEAPYSGINRQSSLSVAASGGKVCTVIWLGGIEAEPWRPSASEWRADLSFTMRQHQMVDGKSKNLPVKRPELEAEARKQAHEITKGRTFNKSNTHEAEAVCIAKATYQRWHSRQAMASGNLRER